MLRGVNRACWVRIGNCNKFTQTYTRKYYKGRKIKWVNTVLIKRETSAANAAAGPECCRWKDEAGCGGFAKLQLE